MDVELPDGSVIQGVPEGTTKAQLAQKLKANGRDVPADWLPKPTATQQFVQSALSGRKAVSNLLGVDLPGSNMLGAMAGGLNLRQQAGQALEKGAYDAGEFVSDKANALGLPPEASAALGAGANVGLNAIPMLIGGVGGARAGAVAGTSALKDVGRDLMGRALRPTLEARKSGDATVAIQTMLDKGLNVTKGGVEKLKGYIDDLDDQITSAITNSNAVINKGEVGKTLLPLWDKFKNQVNPGADLDAIKKAWQEFRDHPLLKGSQDIPVQIAQDLKKGTYKVLAGKYGEQGSASTEAQKGLARGLKEGISNAVPEVAGMNAEQSNMIRTLGVAQRREWMESGKSLTGLAMLAPSPAKLLAYLADHWAASKGLAARLAYSGAKPISQATGGAGGLSLYELGQQLKEDQ